MNTVQVGQAAPMQRFMQLQEVIKVTGLSRSTIYTQISAGIFPKQIPLGLCRAGWLESEVQGWIAERVAAARGGSS